MQLKIFATAALLSAVQTALAFPRITPEEFKRVVRDAAKQKPDVRDGQVGRVVQFDPVPSFTGTKKIPGKIAREVDVTIYSLVKIRRIHTGPQDRTIFVDLAVRKFLISHKLVAHLYS
jgi:hypothetical protein